MTSTYLDLHTRASLRFEGIGGRWNTQDVMRFLYFLTCSDEWAKRGRLETVRTKGKSFSFSVRRWELAFRDVSAGLRKGGPILSRQSLPLLNPYHHTQADLDVKPYRETNRNPATPSWIYVCNWKP